MLKESEIRKIVESVIKNTSLSENDPTVRKQQSDDTIQNSFVEPEIASIVNAFFIYYD